MIVRLLVVTTLAVLTLAPMQAWAECAWVLWSRQHAVLEILTDGVRSVAFGVGIRHRVSHISECESTSITQHRWRPASCGKRDGAFFRS
jgi:hypothetical protein